MSTLQFTDADRDARGFIRVDSPVERTLADLLPPAPAEAPAGGELAPRRPAPVAGRAQLAGAVVACLVALLAVLYLAQRLPAPAAAPLARPSAAPAAQPTTDNRQPTIAATSAAAGLSRPVAAFAAPDGDYLGIIEAGRAYTPTARLGDTWTQIAAPGSGRVWVRAGELAPDPALPDLATPTPRPLPTSPPISVYQAPPPTQCAAVNGGGISVQRCGSASLDELQAAAQAAWNAQFDGNHATVATMTPGGR